ncbi:hypothetical protein BGZ58_004320 [Dissophora ornata]|nr:hypothetical protein BGZ58_004320 [Dissophora ornata]
MSSDSQSSQKLHALDLPEIRLLIARFLTKQELAQCILVSQKWSLGFLPLYWRHVDISLHKLARCHASTLQRQGHHVRILSAGRIEDTSVFNQPSVSLVQELDVMTCASRYQVDGGRGCLKEIVERNKASLAKLIWRCYGRDSIVGRPYRIWADMLEGLGNLVTLDLSNWSMTGLEFKEVLRNCPALKSLTLEASEEVSLSTPEGLIDDTTTDTDGAGCKGAEVLSARKEEFRHYGLERLEFVGNVIPSFLRYVPRIKHLTLRHFLHRDFGEMKDLLRKSPAGTLGELTHLTVLTGCSSSSSFMALINAIPQLVYFYGDVPPEVLDDFLELIIQKHWQTIEHLILRDDPYNSPRFHFNFWRFFECCPQLVTLHIPFSLKDCVTWTSASPDIGSQDPVLRLFEPSKEWVCHDLKSLYLRIKDMDPMKPMDQITFDLCLDRVFASKVKRDQTKRTRSLLERMIFERLSGLEKLEKLNIGSIWYKYNQPTSPHTNTQH